MADLNVTAITDHTIEADDYVYGFDANGSKAPTVGALVNAANGKMAIGVCETAAATAAKVVTCAGWNGLPGQPILINFTNENTASNPTLKINSKGALPIYNGSTREEIIPAGNMLLIVNADATKLQVVYAPTTDVVESGNSRPVSSKGVYNNLHGNDKQKNLNQAGWYKIASFSPKNIGKAILLQLVSTYYNTVSSSHIINLSYGYNNLVINDSANDTNSVFSKICIAYNNNNQEGIDLLVYYNKNVLNTVAYKIINTETVNQTISFNFEQANPSDYDVVITKNLFPDGLYINEAKAISKFQNSISSDSDLTITIPKGIYLIEFNTHGFAEGSALFMLQTTSSAEIRTILAWSGNASYAPTLSWDNTNNILTISSTATFKWVEAINIGDYY